MHCRHKVVQKGSIRNQQRAAADKATSKPVNALPLSPTWTRASQAEVLPGLRALISLVFKERDRLQHAEGEGEGD